MGTLRCLGALLTCLSCACSLLGVGDLQVARCEADGDCAALNRALGPEACRVFVCDETAGACVTEAVDADGDGASPGRCGGGDCDDSDPAVGPDAEEVCGNLVDEDCSGAANDLDCDGVDALANGGDDCDDGDPAVSPRAVEVCGNLADEDCSGAANDLDCDGADALANGGDDCDDSNASVGPHVAEVCDGVDDDCDGLLDAPDEDDDRDGYADACAGAAARDCDDDDPSTHLGAPELCDGVDNDCSIDGVARIIGGRMAEPSEDRDGDGHVAVDASCLEASGGFPKDDCDDREAAVHPGAVEACDGLDNDCDGVPDDAVDGDAPGTACLPIDVSAGRSHACAVRADGAVVCWGRNLDGALGLDWTQPFDAVLVSGIAPAEQVVAGDGFTCALGREPGGESEVACWGLDEVARGGAPDGRDFDEIAGLAGASAITAGASHACALVGGAVYCWGGSAEYQLDGDTLGAGVAPRPVPDLADAVQVDAGGTVSCAVRASGEIACWGSNGQGQLGSDAVGDHGHALVEGIDDAVEVSCGDRTCCAVRELDGGSLWCWGYNGSGGFGCAAGPDCPSLQSSAPVRSAGGMTGLVHVQVRIVPPSVGVSETCGFNGITCVQADSGEVSCWGAGSGADVGADDVAPGLCGCDIAGALYVYTCYRTPVAWAPELADVVDLELGQLFGCFLRGDRIGCWGDDSDWQLGLGRTLGSAGALPGEPASVMASALQISGVSFRMPDLTVRSATAGGVRADDRWPEAADLSLGERLQCATTLDGEVQCLAGDGGWPLGEAAEGPVGGVHDAAHVACGGAHCCALRRAGAVSCWGDGAEGQLGAPGIVDPLCGGACSTVALAVDGLNEVRQVVAGRVHTCAATWSGDVLCWGGNGEGQVGALERRAVPEPRRVAGLPGVPVVALAASPGGDTTCAALETGGVRCWGAALDPSAPGGPDPWTAPGMDTAVQLAMSDADVCARLASGAVRCFGASGWDPSRVIDARDLGCGASHCCLTRTSGQSLCWGEAPAGLLGPDPVSTATPLPVPDMLAL